MWKTLHQLAAPPRLYQICGRLVPWLAAAGIIALATGWVRGFGFAPADYQQGEGYRIMYLHVPAAIWSMGIYAAMAVAAFTGLVWQMKMATLAVRGGLPHYVPACPGGHLVNGYLCGDGGGGVHRAGLADENGHPCRRGDGAGGGGVHLHRAGH
ncbi:cytochrome c biogenesis protein, partial [Salmonella enterica]|uniref:cytochrome c biogenesis protein n=1 Tax=Salmonella enterica TaxID=28901 RepID=UPI001E4D35EC